MQLQRKKKGAPRKPKSLKSKDKKVCAENSNKSGSTARKRTRYTDLYDDIEAKFSVMERAEKVLARLENELPHFVKCMLPSNVAHGFWLVHIVRVNDSDVVGAALCLMEMDASRRGTNAVDRSASKSDGFSYDGIEGSEITNQPQPKDLCYPKTSFLHDHSRGRHLSVDSQRECGEEQFLTARRPFCRVHRASIKSGGKDVKSHNAFGKDDTSF
ncbi:UNVERIFIED_CONTAM: hypothetical protein Sradi_4696600 [Sesamum radiatum]|uniref:Uncharacterized protein n=1 Tax=Sesamum radiatum TaxID=300843 RepID=A0AAW2MT38_SESRA